MWAFGASCAVTVQGHSVYKLHCCVCKLFIDLNAQIGEKKQSSEHTDSLTCHT